jgi:hypothetical protein
MSRSCLQRGMTDFFAMRKIACLAKRLGRVASLLRCVHLDAVMHNRNADGTANRNRLWNRTGASWSAIIVSRAAGFRAIIFI